MKINRKGPQVGGLQPLTLIDFPGKLACVVFLKGCNLRCGYCHNPSLLDPEGPEPLSWEEVGNFLRQRRGFLEGVIFSGGEPTLQPNLLEAAQEVRAMGYAIGVHTNGFFPQHLRRLIEEHLVDFIAADIKAPIRGYHGITGCEAGTKIVESIRMIVDSGLPNEFRTTVHPDLLSDEDILTIAEFLEHLGAHRFVLQKCTPGNTLDPKLSLPAREWVLPQTITRLQERFSGFEVRGDSRYGLNPPRKPV